MPPGHRSPPRVNARVWFISDPSKPHTCTGGACGKGLNSGGANAGLVWELKPGEKSQVTEVQAGREYLLPTSLCSWLPYQDSTAALC